jgi:polar amino acid transport system substrate-binding protein
VAAKLGRPTTIAVVPDTASAFEALRSGKADVVVTGHIYTPERDRDFDFTYSIMNAGQQVMVRSGGHGPSDTPLRTFLDLLLSRPALLWFASAFLLVLIPAHLVLFFGHRSGELIPREGGYFHRLFHALAWSTEVLVGQVPSRPQDKIGRTLAIAWRFVGILFVSLFVAKLTASLTYEQFRGLIGGPDDLAGKVVATQAGSTSVDHLRKLGAQIETFPSPEEAFAALLAEKVDAVVLAAPGLRHYEVRKGSGRVKVVGPEFRKNDLGFMVPLDSPLRRQIDSALVALRADGTYERLREKWFGRE